MRRSIGEYISLELFCFVSLTSSCSLIPFFCIVFVLFSNYCIKMLRPAIFKPHMMIIFNILPPPPPPPPPPPSVSNVLRPCFLLQVVSRIFFCVNRSWTGRITVTELRKSNFLQVSQETVTVKGATLLAALPSLLQVHGS